MSAEPQCPVVPAWASNRQLSTEMRKRNMLRFLFTYACLHIEATMTLRQLSVQCGLTETAITAAIGRGVVSKEIALSVELLVGRKCFASDWLLDPLSLLK